MITGFLRKLIEMEDPDNGDLLKLDMMVTRQNGELLFSVNVVSND